MRHNFIGYLCKTRLSKHFLSDARRWRQRASKSRFYVRIILTQAKCLVYGISVYSNILAPVHSINTYLATACARDRVANGWAQILNHSVIMHDGWRGFDGSRLFLCIIGLGGKWVATLVGPLTPSRTHVLGSPCMQCEPSHYVLLPGMSSDKWIKVTSTR